MAGYGPQASHCDHAYISALERLVGVVRELSQARDINAITAIVRDAARELTGADGATFVLRDGAQCYYADENAMAPLWKGKRFPIETCISGWVMLNRQSVVIEDVYDDPRIPEVAYRPTFVKSLAMVPIRRNAPIGAIGNYWAANYQPSAQEMAILEALADTTSVALENAELYSRLEQQVRTLEVQQSRIQKQHESLEVFTRALAHDLKEPVRTLVSFAGMLRKEPEDPREEESQSTYIGFIHEAAGRMDMLINAVARYTRLDDPTQPVRSLCDISEIVDDIQLNLATLFAERGAKLRYENLPWLNVDPAHLTQLLQRHPPQ